jgi:ATPase subunit of ABC transporter with duplicated ATPase domains
MAAHSLSQGEETKPALIRAKQSKADALLLEPRSPE